MDIIRETICTLDHDGRRIPQVYRHGMGVLPMELETAVRLLEKYGLDYRRTREVSIWSVYQTMFYFRRVRDQKWLMDVLPGQMHANMMDWIHKDRTSAEVS